MICVTVARQSRRLALAGMVNAAHMGADLVEVRLDTFDHAPDLDELTAAKRTPVLFSCRRIQDGGQWSKSEEERLMLLRQAVLAGADYIAVEHDVADQVKAFGDTKRVICYTNTEETPADIAAICEGMLEHAPDVIQVTCKVRTAEETRPLLKLLIKPPAPVVVTGLGWPGLLPALLGRKFSAPWVTAAVERGSESYPGQPTVRDLIDVYHYPDITRETEWVGVTGLTQWDVLTVALLNETFAAQGSSKRCLPVPVGEPDRFATVARKLGLHGVVVTPSEQLRLRPLATELDEQVRFPSWAPDAEEIESVVDVLLPEDGEGEGWRGGSLFPNAAVAALRTELVHQGRSLEGAVVLFLGLTAMTAGLARGVKKRGGVVIFADRDEKAALQFSRWFGGRRIRPEALHTTLHDVLVFGSGPGVDPDLDTDEPAIHPGFLKPGMTLLDLTALPRRTPLMTEAAARGAAVVEPREVLFEYVRRLAYRLRGQEASRRALKRALDRLVEDAVISGTDFHQPLQLATE